VLLGLARALRRPPGDGVSVVANVSRFAPWLTSGPLFFDSRSRNSLSSAGMVGGVGFVSWRVIDGAVCVIVVC
jgi:hypothetical protein